MATKWRLSFQDGGKIAANGGQVSEMAALPEVLKETRAVAVLVQAGRVVAGLPSKI